MTATTAQARLTADRSRRYAPLLRRVEAAVMAVRI